jgi:hypothetical protein
MYHRTTLLLNAAGARQHTQTSAGHPAAAQFGRDNSRLDGSPQSERASARVEVSERHTSNPIAWMHPAWLHWTNVTGSPNPDNLRQSRSLMNMNNIVVWRGFDKRGGRSIGARDSGFGVIKGNCLLHPPRIPNLAPAYCRAERRPPIRTKRVEPSSLRMKSIRTPVSRPWVAMNSRSPICL